MRSAYLQLDCGVVGRAGVTGKAPGRKSRGESAAKLRPVTCALFLAKLQRGFDVKLRIRVAP